ncbi:tetratricopeptide repeat protein [Bacteroidota bacterium]
MKFIVKIILLIFLFSINSYSQNIDSLIKATKQIQDDSLKGAEYLRIARMLYYSNPDSSKYCVKQGMKIAIKTQNNYLLCKSHNILGIVYDVTSKWDSALICYNTALTIANKCKAEDIKASAFNNIGLIHWNKGEFDKALIYYNKSLKLYEKLDLIKGVANCLNNIGLIYYQQERYEEALEYHKMALKNRKEINDEYGIGASYQNIGEAFSDLDNYDSTIYYYRKAISQKRKIIDIYGLAIVYNNIGIEYRYTKLDSSKFYCLKSIEIYESFENYGKCASSIFNLAASYYNHKKYNKAKEFYLKAIEYAEKAEAMNVLYKSYHDLAKIYFMEKDYKQTAILLQKRIVIHDSLYKMQRDKAIADIQTKYETEKKDKENQLLQQEGLFKDEKNAKLEEQKKVQIISFIAAILLIIGIVIRYYYRIKIRQQKAQEEHQQQRFKAVIEAEEKERIRIAKDLHDGLGQLLSTAKINMTGLEGELNDEEDEVLLNNSMALVDEAVTEVRNISHNMMPSALIEFGLTRAIEALTSRINDAKLIKVSFNYSGLDERLEQSTEIALFRIIQEVLNNMIKHSEAAEILIELNKIDKKVHLKIQDNGKGFDVSKIDQSKGIGWKNIYSRLSMINGHIDIKSRFDKGTVINISLVI